MDGHQQNKNEDNVQKLESQSRSNITEETRLWKPGSGIYNRLWALLDIPALT